MACEVGCGAAESRMKRSAANELAENVVSKFEKGIPEAPIGKMFQECYDVRRIVPKDDYNELYKNVKKELQDIGIPFIY